MGAFKKSTGGKEIISQKKIEIIAGWIRDGHTQGTAAAMAGISRDCLNRWIKKGWTPSGKVKQDSIYGRLINALEVARAQANVKDMDTINSCAEGQDAIYERYPEDHPFAGQLILTDKGNPILIRQSAPKDWQAAKWKLSRREPRDYGDVQRIEHTGKDGGPIESLDKKPLTSEEIKKLEKTVQERAKQILALDDPDDSSSKG